MFKLEFTYSAERVETYDISEPVGYDSIPFVLKQKEKGYGRDVFYGGDGENEFTFYKRLDHQFTRLLFFFNTFGWEAKVRLIIELDNVEDIVGNLDFRTASTDQLQEFKCRVIQDNNEAILKRRTDIDVDLFSTEDLDGNELQPIEIENVLLRSTPRSVSSSWIPSDVTAFTGVSNNIHSIQQNAFNNIQDSGIKDVLTFLETTFSHGRSQATAVSQNGDTIKQFRILEAQDNLNNAKLSISGLVLSFYISNGEDFSDNYGFSHQVGGITPRIGVGTEDNPILKYDEFEFMQSTFEYIETVDISTLPNTSGFTGLTDRYDLTFDDFEINLPEIVRGDSIFIGFNMNRFFTYVRWRSDKGVLKISASSSSYNTIVPSVKLLDAIKHTVSSISRLNVSFPLLEQGGELYNHRIFNGNLLRLLTDRKFIVKFKDFVEWMQEINADYEVFGNAVTFLNYAGFYADELIKTNGDVRFDTYRKSINERFGINEFNYDYEKYQSQKENEVQGTFEVVHGKSQWSILNEFAENKKNIKIPFVRDSFRIDDQRRKALIIDEETSTQDDQTIYLLDSFENTTGGLTFTEVDVFRHSITSSVLSLTFRDKVNWELLGLSVDTEFIINGENEGEYTVTKVEGQTIELSGGVPTFEGEAVITFTYTVTRDKAKFISWSNEDFQYIDNITNVEGFSNLRFSPKRNILNFWQNYLASCNIFAKKPIKNTNYINNGELSMSYEGFQTVEAEDFTPETPLLSPYIHNVTLIMTLQEYLRLVRDVRNIRGYIKLEDANKHQLLLYPKTMEYVNEGECGRVEIVGEEKFTKGIINLVSAEDSEWIIINGENRVRRIIYEIEQETVYLRGANGVLLYPPVFWNKITVNNAVASDLETLETWLEALS